MSVCTPILWFLVPHDSLFQTASRSVSSVFAQFTCVRNTRSHADHSMIGRVMTCPVVDSCCCCCAAPAEVKQRWLTRRWASTCHRLTVPARLCLWLLPLLLIVQWTPGSRVYCLEFVICSLLMRPSLLLLCINCLTSSFTDILPTCQVAVTSRRPWFCRLLQNLLWFALHILSWISYSPLHVTSDLYPV